MKFYFYRYTVYIDIFSSIQSQILPTSFEFLSYSWQSKNSIYLYTEYIYTVYMYIIIIIISHSGHWRPTASSTTANSLCPMPSSSTEFQLLLPACLSISSLVFPSPSSCLLSYSYVYKYLYTLYIYIYIYITEMQRRKRPMLCYSEFRAKAV